MLKEKAAFTVTIRTLKKIKENFKTTRFFELSPFASQKIKS